MISTQTINQNEVIVTFINTICKFFRDMKGSSKRMPIKRVGNKIKGQVKMPYEKWVGLK